MRFTAIAVAAGLVVGVLLGGRLRHLGERPFRLWPFLAAGILLQLPLLDPLGFGGLLASYACLLIFALANVHLVGMALVAIGIVLNAAVITANSGMPVHRRSVVDAGIAKTADLDTLHTDRKHHLQTDTDRLTPLADIIPVRPLHEVISFGDVVMAIGVADVLVHLLRKPKAKRLRRQADQTDQTDPFDQTDETQMPANGGSDARPEAQAETAAPAHDRGPRVADGETG